MIGVFSNGLWLLNLNGNRTWGGRPVDRAYVFGSAGDIPVVGDWNGDSVDEIGIYSGGLWLLDLNGNFVWDDGWYGFGSSTVKPVVGKW